MCLSSGVVFPEPTVSDLCAHRKGDLTGGELETVTGIRRDILACALSLNFDTDHSVGYT